MDLPGKGSQKRAIDAENTPFAITTYSTKDGDRLESDGFSLGLHPWPSYDQELGALYRVKGGEWKYSQELTVYNKPFNLAAKEIFFVERSSPEEEGEYPPSDVAIIASVLKHTEDEVIYVRVFWLYRSWSFSANGVENMPKLKKNEVLVTNHMGILPVSDLNGRVKNLTHVSNDAEPNLVMGQENDPLFFRFTWDIYTGSLNFAKFSPDSALGQIVSDIPAPPVVSLFFDQVSNRQNMDMEPDFAWFFTPDGKRDEKWIDAADPNPTNIRRANGDAWDGTNGNDEPRVENMDGGRSREGSIEDDMQEDQSENDEEMEDFRVETCGVSDAGKIEHKAYQYQVNQYNKDLSLFYNVIPNNWWNRLQKVDNFRIPSSNAAGDAMETEDDKDGEFVWVGDHAYIQNEAKSAAIGFDIAQILEIRKNSENIPAHFVRVFLHKSVPPGKIAKKALKYGRNEIFPSNDMVILGSHTFVKKVDTIVHWIEKYMGDPVTKENNNGMPQAWWRQTYDHKERILRPNLFYTKSRRTASQFEPNPPFNRPVTRSRGKISIAPNAAPTGNNKPGAAKGKVAIGEAAEAPAEAAEVPGEVAQAADEVPEVASEDLEEVPGEGVQTPPEA